MSVASCREKQDGSNLLKRMHFNESLMFWQAGSVGVDKIDPGVKFFSVRLAAVNIFLILCYFLVVLERVDDVGPNKDDHVAFFVILPGLAECSADQRQAPEAWKSGLMVGLGVADHPAQNEEVFIGNMDMGSHVRLGGADAINGIVIPHRLVVDALRDLLVEAQGEK